MPIPFVKMCTARCKRRSTLTFMFITAFLVLYAVVSLGGDGEKDEKLKEVVMTQSEDDFVQIQPQEILDKVKEIPETDEEISQKIDASEDQGQWIDKLFDNNESGEGGSAREDGTGGTHDEVVGCDACGEVVEDVDIPFAITTRRIVAGETPTTTMRHVNGSETKVIEMNPTLVLTPEEKELRRHERANRTLARETNKKRKETLMEKERHYRTMINIAEHRRLAALSNITRVQKNRRLRLENACGNSLYLKYQNLLYKDTLQHLFVVDSQKLLFCYIPKVGCSNWKRILMVLAGKQDNMEDITSREAHSRNGLTPFGKLSMSDQLYRLQNYRKVMFVREPFTRIISAYKNKYKDLSVFRMAPEYLKQVARRIMRKYRPGATPQDLLTGENITWAEFTDYLSDPVERPQFDEHWKESYKLCSPCKIKYDFIGKLENIEKEANYVLQNSQFSLNLTYPTFTNSHPTNSASTNISHYFNDFTKDKLEALWNIYRIDYALFDYKKPSFVP